MDPFEEFESTSMPREAAAKIHLTPDDADVQVPLPLMTEHSTCTRHAHPLSDSPPRVAHNPSPGKGRLKQDKQNARVGVRAHAGGSWPEPGRAGSGTHGPA